MTAPRPEAPRSGWPARADYTTPGAPCPADPGAQGIATKQVAKQHAARPGQPFRIGARRPGAPPVSGVDARPQRATCGYQEALERGGGWVPSKRGALGDVGHDDANHHDPDGEEHESRRHLNELQEHEGTFGRGCRSRPCLSLRRPCSFLLKIGLPHAEIELLRRRRCRLPNRLCRSPRKASGGRPGPDFRPVLPFPWNC